MSGPFVVLVLLLALAAGALLTLAVTVPRRAGGGPSSAPPLPLLADRAAARARSRSVLGLLAALVVGLLAVALQAARPGWLGLPLALGPGLAGAVGLLVFSLVPAPRLPAATVTSASLEPRRPWSFGSRRSFGVPAAVGVVLVAGLLVAGTVAGPDDRGLSRSFPLAAADGSVSGAAGPFPGWYYGVPLLVVTVLLLTAAWLALARIATTSALPGDRLRAADRQWRTSSTRVVSRLTTAALLAYAGGTAFYAGRAVHNAAATMTDNGVTGFEATGTVGSVLTAAGALLVLAAAARLGAAVLEALRTRTLTRTALAPERAGTLR